MSDYWDEEVSTSAAPSSGGDGFGKSSNSGFSSSDDSGFGSRGNGDDSGFGKPSRGFGGRGRGRGGGFGSRNGDNETSNGWGDNSDDKPSGFGGGGRGGFKGRHRDDENDGSGGFGGRGFGGGRGGFKGHRRDDENGGGGGGFRGRNRDNDGEDGGGFGSRRGGFGGGRGGFKGRNRDNDDGEDGGSFGSGRSGFGGGRGGFKSRRRDDEKGEGGGGFGDGEEGGEGKKRELYIPPAPPEDEETMFATMAVGLNFEKYEDIPVEVTGRDPPQYITTFEQCDFFETTRKNIEHCNYTRPTPVQKYAIPIISTGRDLMACAQTGSGKTAAFLLPVITRMIRENVSGASQNDSQSPEVLIVSPTRELTLQIYNEARKFVHSSIYRPVVVYGGTSVGHQLRQLEMGCNILVATPGRLVDFLTRKKVLLDNLKVLILDEADRMLDMGFEPEIRKVVEQFGMPGRGSRQTLMFSATFPEDIQRLAAEFLHDHLFLTVGVVGGTTSDIKQMVIEVGEGGSDKREKLQDILVESGTNRVLVFVETKRNADFLAGLLCQEDFPTTSIHGDRLQREREEALRDFRSGKCRVLVATSVAARGLDIPKVTHVINYDLPSSIEEYVHRIGRTGRIGNQGMATAFFQGHKDGALARSLVKVLADAHQEVPEFLEQAASQAVGSNYGPTGGKFASKDIRYGGGRGRRGDNGGFGGDSSGHGNDTGGFGGFDESSTGGFGASNQAAEDEEW